MTDTNTVVQTAQVAQDVVKLAQDLWPGLSAQSTALLLLLVNAACSGWSEYMQRRGANAGNSSWLSKLVAHVGTNPLPAGPNPNFEADLVAVISSAIESKLKAQQPVPSAGGAAKDFPLVPAPQQPESK